MTKDFWKAAGIRALRTVAQTAVAMIPTAVTIAQVDWVTVAGTAALAGVCSVLTSIATGLPEMEA
jgi:hypothetical protein